MRVFAAAVLVLSACSAPPSAPVGAAPAASPQASLRVEAAGRTDGFTTGTREIAIELAWPGGTGRRVSLEIYAPGGTLYQRQLQPVEAGGAARFVLPVAGTMISEYQLTGTWEVRAWPEGGEDPLAAAEFAVGGR